MKKEQFSKILAVSLIIVLYPIFVYLNGYVGNKMHSMDLPSFYQAADMVFNENASPYGADVLATINGRITYPYLYPPATLLLFYPFSLANYASVKTIFLFINHLVLLLSFYLLFGKILRDELVQRIHYAPFFVIYFFLFFPFVLTIGYGQVNLIVLCCLLWMWHGLKFGRPDWEISLPLVLAILLKTYPAIFLVLFFIRKRWRVLTYALSGLVVINVLAWLVLPVKVWADWFYLVMPGGGYFHTPLGLESPAAPGNQSINALMMRLFSDSEYVQGIWPGLFIGRYLAYVFSGFFIAATCWICWRVNRTDAGRPVDLEISLFMICMVLVAPISWVHHLVFVFPAVITAFISRDFIPGRILALILIALSIISFRYLPRPMVLSGFWILANALPIAGMAALWHLYYQSAKLQAVPGFGLQPGAWLRRFYCGRSIGEKSAP